MLIVAKYGKETIKMSKVILSYTRQPINNVLYDPRLAYSMHLAISEEDGSFKALNHNSGVLFSLATENENGSLNPKCIKSPYIFKLKEGGFGVVAVRTGAEGEEDEESKGSVLLWKSEDLVRYDEIGLLSLGEEFIDKVFCVYREVEDDYVLSFRDAKGQWFITCMDDVFTLKAGEVKAIDAPSCEMLAKVGLFSEQDASKVEKIQGVVPYSTIEVSDAVADRLCKKLLTPINVGMEFPAQVTASSKEELDTIFATALYSDGTRAKKRVDWDLSGVDFDKKGECTITGLVHKEHFEFPIAFNRADPCMTKWNGKYYFIATNDADHEHTMYIREADSIPELVTAEDHLILDSTTYEGIGGLLWAPEFHEVEGRLYIFHACTPGPFFHEECHLMTLKEGGNPINRADWSQPRKILKKDGTELCEAGKTISLDMTCFNWEGDYYVIWSQREFLPEDLGAWLYIAKLNPKEPWKLLTDPVVLSKPDYGWANNHTFVDEGPFALMRGDKLFITFSSAAVDSSYVVSYLEIARGKDLLKASNWRKNNYPILTSRSVEGEFGTGHNAYVIDDDGVIWNTYHARPGTEGVRSSGVRRVHFDVDDCPVLDLTEDLDVVEEYRKIQTKLIIK